MLCSIPDNLSTSALHFLFSASFLLRLFARFFMFLCFCLSVRLSVCLSGGLSVRLSVVSVFDYLGMFFDYLWFCFAVMVAQITDRVRHFLSEPVAVKVTVARNHSLLYPAITICNKVNTLENT